MNEDSCDRSSGYPDDDLSAQQVYFRTYWSNPPPELCLAHHLSNSTKSEPCSSRARALTLWLRLLTCPGGSLTPYKDILSAVPERHNARDSWSTLILAEAIR